MLRKWLLLHLTDQVGAVTFKRLLDYFGDIDGAVNATAGELSTVPRIGSKTAAAIVSARDEVDVDGELALADELGVTILTLDSDEYPAPLRKIHAPPPVLYVQGNIIRDDLLAIAVVGSRSCSHYGSEQAGRFSHLLAAAGFTIVSGLARGIDTAAHRGALAAKGRTIAVQGRGLAGVFPPENADLASEISRNGAVISEFPLRYEPLSRTFPMRNRIIAGLTAATIVVEARNRSGALITARHAVENNREVMAVPGRVDAPGSVGPHRLIKDGAKLVENVQDVMDALGYIGETLNDHASDAATHADRSVEQATLFDVPSLPLTDRERPVFETIEQEPIHIDHIISTTELPTAHVNAALTSLQLKGRVKQLPGSYYQRR